MGFNVPLPWPPPSPPLPKSAVGALPAPFLTFFPPPKRERLSSPVIGPFYVSTSPPPRLSGYLVPPLVTYVVTFVWTLLIGNKKSLLFFPFSFFLYLTEYYCMHLYASKNTAKDPRHANHVLPGAGTQQRKVAGPPFAFRPLHTKSSQTSHHLPLTINPAPDHRIDPPVTSRQRIFPGLTCG
jgi:hypothetical protein